MQAYYAIVALFGGLILCTCVSLPFSHIHQECLKCFDDAPLLSLCLKESC